MRTRSAGMPPVSGVTSPALKAFTSESGGKPRMAGHCDRKYSSPPALATASTAPIEVLVPGRGAANANSTSARTSIIHCAWTPAIDVAVRNGVVQLSGIVTDERQRLGLLRRFSPTDLRMPPRGRRLRPSSALSIRIVLPHLRRRVPAVAKFGVPQW
jgi:hypothetical protein